MRLKITPCGLLVLLLAIPWTVHTAPAPDKTLPLTLDQAVQMALENNLDVRIQRFNPIIDRYNLGIAYGAYDPNLSFAFRRSFRASGGGVISSSSILASPSEIDDDSYDIALGGIAPTGLRYNISASEDRSSGTRSGAAGPFLQYGSFTGITLTQPLLRDFWIDTYRAQIQISKKNIQFSELGLRLQIMTTITRVEEAYYNLIFARENVKVQKQALELAERLLDENRRRVEVGALAPLDEKQAEAQVAARRADLLAAQRDLAVQENVLKRLMIDDFAQWQVVNLQPVERLVAVPETFNVAESWAVAFAQRPDLAQLQLDLERRDILLRFQRNQVFPQLDLVGSYGRSGLRDSFDASLDDIRTERLPSHSYGVVLSIPLGNRSARNRYQATQAEKKQAILEYKRLEQEILVQVDDIISLARTSFQRVEATRQARLYSEAALNAEQKKLEFGRSTSFVVLQLQRDLTSALSAEIRALADYNIALARLAFNQGTTLERRHIELNYR